MERYHAGPIKIATVMLLSLLLFTTPAGALELSFTTKNTIVATLVNQHLYGGDENPGRWRHAVSSEFGAVDNNNRGRMHSMIMTWFQRALDDYNFLMGRPDCPKCPDTREGFMEWVDRGRFGIYEGDIRADKRHAMLVYTYVGLSPPWEDTIWGIPIRVDATTGLRVGCGSECL